MEIENQNLLEHSLRNGVNLFLGSGFSILAKDKANKTLPTGAKLCDELKIYFNKPGNFSLSQLASIMEANRKEEFYSYLQSRFTVKDFPDLYNCLLDINIRSIFTTNIDDLLHNIYLKSTTKYLNDVSLNGSNPNDESSIDFSALHGTIRTPEKSLLFDTSSLANAYSRSPRTWNYLSMAIERYPTIFCGYSFNDSGVIQAVMGQGTLVAAQKEKWIIILEEDKELYDYYKSLKFNVILSNTQDFLQYLSKVEKGNKLAKENFSDIKYLFPINIVPKNAVGLKVRPINEFFIGNPPIWSDIFSGQIYKTSHFYAIKDKIFSNKNVIVLGTPAAGKSTLMMQVATDIEFTDGIKLAFNNIEYSKASLLVRILGNRRALIFIDNFCDSLEAFNFLSKYSNITLIGFEREHNYGIASHLINEDEYYISNVTELTEADIQGIYNFLPTTIRNTVLKRELNDDYVDDSLFEFISRNVKSPNLAERFTKVIDELEKSDPQLAEFLVLCSYVHYARVPLSFEMVYSYFSEEIESYDDVFDMRNKLGELLIDYSGELLIDDTQDYYYPRSVYMAETILKHTGTELLKKVIGKTLENIPTVQICSYNIYRKRAYDKNIISRAFTNWKDGKNFYEKVYINDFENPYVLQQGALYLAYKKIYTDAFHWIDRALTQTDNKYFSIRNSHAFILFDANINAQEENDEIRRQLDKSMAILEKCFHDDKRRSFHAIGYGEQAILYNNRYYDEVATKYLRNAQTWLKEELVKKTWNIGVSNTLKKVEARLNTYS
jgi:hypothetical protein